MLRKILYTLTLFSILLLAYLVFDFVKFYNSQQNLAFDKGKSNTELLKKQINDELLSVVNAAEALANNLSTNPINSKENLEQLIEEKSYELPTILGITVAYEPNSWDATTKLYSPYYDKNLKKNYRCKSRLRLHRQDFNKQQMVYRCIRQRSALGRTLLRKSSPNLSFGLFHPFFL